MGMACNEFAGQPQERTCTHDGDAVNMTLQRLIRPSYHLGEQGEILEVIWAGGPLLPNYLRKDALAGDNIGSNHFGGSQLLNPGKHKRCRAKRKRLEAAQTEGECETSLSYPMKYSNRPMPRLA